MSKEIIILEEKRKKKEKFLQLLANLQNKDFLNYNFFNFNLFAPLLTLVYSLFVSLLILEYSFLIIIYGLVSFILIFLLKKYVKILIIEKTKINENIKEKYSGKILITEINEIPEKYSEKIIELGISSILVPIFNITLFFLFSKYIGNNLLSFALLFFTIILPLLILLYYILLPILKEGRINSEIEKEIPMAATLFTIFSASNMNPYLVFQTLSKNPFFKIFKKIYLQIEKLRFLLILNPIEAISLFTKFISNHSLKGLLRTVTAINLGSDLYLLFKEKMQDIFKYLEKKIESLIEKFNIMIASQLIIFVIIPITVAITMTFIGMANIIQAIFLFYIFPISFFILFFIMLKSYAPSFYRISTENSLKMFYFILFLILIFLLIYLLNYISLSYFIFFSLLFSSFLIYLLSIKEIKKREKLLESLPIIVRDLSEEIKKGNSPYQALEKIYTRYDDEVQIFLKRIIFERKLGSHIEKTLEKEKLPLIFKQVFTTIDESDRVGADPSTFSDLADFINKLENIRKLYKLKVKFFKFSSYLVSGLLGFAIGIVINVINNLILTFSNIVTSPLFFSSSFIIFSGIGNMITEMLLISSYVNSLLLGILGGSMGNDIKLGMFSGFICLLLNFFTVQAILYFNFLSIS